MKLKSKTRYRESSKSTTIYLFTALDFVEKRVSYDQMNPNPFCFPCAAIFAEFQEVEDGFLGHLCPFKMDHQKTKMPLHFKSRFNTRNYPERLVFGQIITRVS